jgi:hypothetical protein
LRGDEETKGPNLIGRCTSDELVTEVRLVLRGFLVLGPDTTINTTQHTSQRTTYGIVSLGIVVV